MGQQMIDLTLKMTDNMPAHKLFQRPVIVPHYTHEKTMQDFELGTPNDRLSFATSMAPQAMARKDGDRSEHR